MNPKEERAMSARFLSRNDSRYGYAHAQTCPLFRSALGSPLSARCATYAQSLLARPFSRIISRLLAAWRFVRWVRAHFFFCATSDEVKR